MTTKKTKEKTLAGPGGSTLAIIWKDPSTLKVYPRNAKLHPPDQIAGIAAQISAFGFDQPIVITPENIIIKGHGRREASLSLGLKKVPCIISDLTEAQAAASRIGDNKIAESGWNQDFLSTEFQDFSKNFPEMLLLTGFSENERQMIECGWKTDLQHVEETKEHLDGITAVIKIRCPKELRDTIKDFVLTRVAEQGFSGVEVE